MKTLIRIAALLLGALVLTPASAQPSDPGDWVPCAREGQTCFVPGLAQVRFGAPGRFSVAKNVDGRIECEISEFGDPARRVPKLCEYRLGWDRALPRPEREARERGWEDCAQEGEVCRFRGERVVRFGADGAYNLRRETGQIECSVEEFGDPIYGARKKCQARTAGRGEPERGDPGSRDNDHFGGVAVAPGMDRRDANRWAFCADEGNSCSPSAPTLVRYGVPGQYHYRQVAGAFRCDAKSFGDPAPGVQKTCDINTVPVDRTVARRPDADEIPPLDDRFWVACAKESQTCRFRGEGHVRFGANGLYRVVHARDGVNCDARSFGGDPTPKTPKACAVYRP
ncbi:hypothetical protein [Hydrogenophaga sp. SL48]|uniref:hypothetical protein n=1 Tax=Hydrogenophaga sp. SL48 TaxID=2806347 RepID=UPI001F42E165|nr:hypothetical protein [Hydrogenophaga sp. SL48]UJW81831.1 hypothetical protein IM738_03675 [Hydrogenophaga sp. SL48]